MSPIFIGHIRDTPEWTERLDLDRKLIDFKLEILAQANIFSFKVYSFQDKNCSPPARFLQDLVVVTSYAEAQLRSAV